MKITMLGTGAALPDPDRGQSAILLTLDDDTHYLFDCGEGATRQMVRADVDPADGSTILLHVNGKIPDDALLHYGHGRDPLCNLRDDADMGALVFGPLPLSR